MSEIEPADLAARLADGDDPYVLDIRDEADFRDWHVPGSHNVALYEDLQNDPEGAKDALADVPADREIVTVCAAGVVSQTATDVLTELGYEATTLADGMAGWSRVHRYAPVDVDVDGTLVQVARPGKGCLSYVLVSDGGAAVFDPSQYVTEYEAILKEYGAELVAVYDSHAHADHVSGGRRLADRNGVPYHLHPADALEIDAAPLAEGDVHEIGAVVMSVLHTPGHSPGGVTFAVEDQALLTGDTLFHESVGRVELGVEAGLQETDVEANAEQLYDSLQRLRERPGDPLVLPAHDPGSPEPPVTARMSGVERRNDDLGLSREAFVERLAGDVPDHPPNFERVKRVNVGAETADDEELAALEVGPNRCAAE